MTSASGWWCEDGDSAVTQHAAWQSLTLLLLLPQLTPACRDLLNRIFVMDEDQRITIAQVHPRTDHGLKGARTRCSDCQEAAACLCCHGKASLPQGLLTDRLLNSAGWARRALRKLRVIACEAVSCPAAALAVAPVLAARQMLSEASMITVRYPHHLTDCRAASQCEMWNFRCVFLLLVTCHRCAGCNSGSEFHL